MIRIIGKVYPFKDKLAWSNTNGYFLIKKVIKFDTKNRPITQHLGVIFEKEEMAIEYCHWWNIKYYKGQEND